MITFISTQKFWMKFLLVRGRTSLQSHSNRTEYHISIRGIQKVKPQKIHRINRGMYIEIATGEPHENDIIRYEDDYGRI